MKRFIILVCVLLSVNAVTAQNKPITLTKNKVTQLIFPDKIKKYRGGFSPTMFALDQYENSLYIQCLVEFEESNLSVITEDNNYYIFDIVYSATSSQNAYVIKLSDKINADQDTMPSESISSQIPISSLSDSGQDQNKDSVISTILTERGYIVSNNGVKSKNMEVFLKGIYTHKQDIYFRIELTNTSHIPYTYNYIGFALTSKKKGKVSSIERIDLQPTASYIPSKLIQYNETLVVIYKLKKFTPGSDRILNIEVIENDGERNFSFPISENIILNARSI